MKKNEQQNNRSWEKIFFRESDFKTLNFYNKTLAWFCIFIMLLLTGCKNSEITHDVETNQKPWTHLNFYNNPDNFHFVIISDKCGGARDGVFQKAVEKLNLLNPEFVICIGDLIEGYEEDQETITNEWSELNSLVKKFQMPFFYVPGNHDISNKAMADSWEELFGRSYYYFIYKNVLFMCLNSQETPEYIYESSGRFLSSEQIAWAKLVLEKYPDVRWTCIFMHQPLWIYEKESIGVNGKKYPARNTGFNEIENSLKGRDYTIFAGHYHQYTKYIRNGKDYIVLATTGGGSNLRGPALGEFDHGMWISMTDNGPVIANLQIDGILDKDVVTEEKLLEIKKNDPFLNTIKFVPDEGNFGEDFSFYLPVKNIFQHKLKYDFTWKNFQSGWKITPEKSAGIVEPGKEKILHFESVTKNKIGMPATCDMKFSTENGINIKLELSTKQLITRVNQPTVEAIHTAQKPVIDGKLDDPVWKEGKEINTFLTMYGEDISVKTLAYLAYDKDNLYIAFKCLEPNIKGISNKVKKHDGPVWKDDSIEVLIDPNKDRESCYQLIINPSAVIYDSFYNNGIHYRSYEINPEARTWIGNDSWTLEMAVPWKNLNAKAPGKNQTMGLLLTRTRKNEIQQYPAIYGGNHQPEKFGTLKFK